MTRIERKAALAVAAAAIGATAAGISLLRKHGKYLAKKAAATFGTDNAKDVEEETAADKKDEQRQA